jgi:hypothetical protein
MKVRGRTYADTLHRFRRHLWKGLRDPRVVRVAKLDWVTGLLRHEGGDARVFILLNRRPLLDPPLVICQEPWVRRNPEWHCDPNFRAFCWVLPRAWRDHFSWRAGYLVDSRVLAKDAATWFLQAMSVQLSRHWVSTKEGIYEWPAEWEDYSHDAEGLREYLHGSFRKR